MNVVALLDDRDATETNPTSRLYTGFMREHRNDEPASLDATWAAVEDDQRAGLHALLLADYEWGARRLKAGHERLAPNAQGALRVLMFERCETLSRDAATRWLEVQPGAIGPAGTMDLRASVDRAEFTETIGRIHEAIAAGETYQVNYTYRLHGRTFGSPLALYRALRARQPVAFGAFVVLPPGGDTTHVLSCSPELFVRA
jgi:para-aminobenzoate synthetase/4-amino-4-deoxychorismate lyase